MIKNDKYSYDWESIENAPKDGTVLVLKDKSGGQFTGYFDRYEKQWIEICDHSVSHSFNVAYPVFYLTGVQKCC